MSKQLTIESKGVNLSQSIEACIYAPGHFNPSIQTGFIKHFTGLVILKVDLIASVSMTRQPHGESWQGTYKIYWSF